MKRNKSIDALRGLAAILVVLCHSFIVYPIDISNVLWCRIIRLIAGSFYMELFFLLSGAVYSFKGSSYFKKKLLRIGVPYIFFGLLSIAFHVFGGRFVNGDIDFLTGLYQFLLFGGDYWFLYVLLIISFLYPLLDLILKKNKIVYFFIFACLIIVPNFLKIPSIVCTDRVILYLPFFMIGHCFKGFLFALPSKKEFNLSLFFVPLSFLLFAFKTKYSFDIPAFNLIVSLSFILSLCFAANGITRVKLPFLTICGKYSLQIYCFNGYILSVMRFVLCSLLSISSPTLIVIGIFVPVVSITLLSCHYVIERIGFLRFLCGMPSKTAPTETKKGVA